MLNGEGEAVGEGVLNGEVNGDGVPNGDAVGVGLGVTSGVPSERKTVTVSPEEAVLKALGLV